MPMACRTDSRLCLARSWPSSRSLPLSGSIRRAASDKSVDFPAPFGPTSAIKLPGSAATVTFSTIPDRLTLTNSKRPGPGFRLGASGRSSTNTGVSRNSIIFSDDTLAPCQYSYTLLKSRNDGTRSPTIVIAATTVPGVARPEMTSFAPINKAAPLATAVTLCVMPRIRPIFFARATRDFVRRRL